MKPIKTSQTNIIYKAEGCDDLPATNCERSIVSTVWTFTDAERTAIFLGANVELFVWRQPTPPVCLQVTKLQEIP